MQLATTVCVLFARADQCCMLGILVSTVFLLFSIIVVAQNIILVILHSCYYLSVTWLLLLLHVY